MISQRVTRYNRIEISPEITVQAAMTLLSQQRRSVSIPRWVCEVCGMIHTQTMPGECESCGTSVLAQMADTHREMNNHW